MNMQNFETSAGITVETDDCSYSFSKSLNGASFSVRQGNLETTFSFKRKDIRLVYEVSSTVYSDNTKTTNFISVSINSIELVLYLYGVPSHIPTPVPPTPIPVY